MGLIGPIGLIGLIGLIKHSPLRSSAGGCYVPPLLWERG